MNPTLSESHQTGALSSSITSLSNLPLDVDLLLQNDVCIEPLVLGWSAWPLLLAPASLALFLSKRLLPLLDDFLEDPSAHTDLAGIPSMYGGHFVCKQEADIPAISALAIETRKRAADLLALADAWQATNQRLQTAAVGQSLNDFYTQLPSALQGLVELVYDLHHRPAVRLFEELVTDAYPLKTLTQIYMHRADPTERDFFMCTPRLARPQDLMLNWALDDPRIDKLTSLRTNPATLSTLKDALGLDDQQLSLLASMCQPAPKKGHEDDHSAALAPGDVRVRYFGHACILVQSAEQSILIDPYFSMKAQKSANFSVHDLPERIDWVVFSHSHQDHLSAEMLLQLRARIGRIAVPRNNAGSIADPSLKLILGQLGFSNVVELSPFDRIELPGGNLMSLPFTGEHCDLDIRTKHALYLTLNDHRAMFLVDSDGRDVHLYKRLLARVGPLDAVYLGMECEGAPLNWLYGPVLGAPTKNQHAESRRLCGADCERAWSIVNVLQPREVYVYAMGQEPWMQSVMGLQYASDSIQLVEAERFVARCQSHGFHASRLFMKAEINYGNRK